ncbi:MAG TPA: hypothetical protein VM733_14145 [Thermoanaerobaculia bacterium]|nr:hypothetical protein [Thermoanaerobaculia bacterium]
MTQRNILLLMVLAVVGLTVVDAFVVYGLQDPTRYVAHATLRSLALGIAAVTAAMTAARFRWAGEYVGRAWTLLFTLYAFLTVSYVLNRVGIKDQMLADVMTIAGNLAAIGAFWLFSRALRKAGLQFYGPASVKIGVIVAAVAVASVLVVPTMIDIWRSDAGLLSRVADFVSSGADFVTFMLVAPLLLTLWSFRGGQLSWVYGCLALSTIGWMINSAADNLLPEVAVREAQMTGLFLACMAVAAAAYSQLATSRSRMGAAHV